MAPLRMLHSRGSAAATAAALLAGGVIGLGAQSAGAVSFAGQLVGHGVGSVFAVSGSDLTEGVAVNGTATYTFEVINPAAAGNGPAQFLVSLPSIGGGTQVLKTGSTVITQTAETDGYYTNLLAPGKFQTFVLTVNLGSTTLPVEDDTTLRLSSTTGSTLGELYMATYRKAPAKGSDVVDQFVKGAGGQFLGGTDPYYVATTTALKLKAKATFTVQLQNDGLALSDPVVNISTLFGSAPSYPVSVKVGTVDITQLVLNGGWSSPTVLKPGGKLVLTVTVTRAGTDPDGVLYQVDSYDALSNSSQSTQYLEASQAA